MDEKRDLEQSPLSVEKGGAKPLRGNVATEVVYHHIDVFGQEEGHDVW